MRRQPSDSWHGASTLKKIFGAGEKATRPPCTAIEKLLRLPSTRGVPGLHLNWLTHPTHVLHYVTSAWQKHGCKDGELACLCLFLCLCPFLSYAYAYACAFFSRPCVDHAAATCTQAVSSSSSSSSASGSSSPSPSPLHVFRISCIPVRRGA